MSKHFYYAHLTDEKSETLSGLWEAVESPLVEIVAFGLFPISRL